jgi:fructokinase
MKAKSAYLSVCDFRMSRIKSITNGPPWGVVYGPSLIDCRPDGSQTVGGANLNFAAQLAAQGWRVAFVTRIGADDAGEMILTALRRTGVDARWVQIDPRLPSGRVTVAAANESPPYVIHGPAAWDAIEPPEGLPAADLFYHGSVDGRSPRARGTLRELIARAVGRLQVFDLNFRPPDIDESVVRAGVSRANLLKADRAELEALAAMLGIEASPAALFSIAPRLQYVCLTAAQRGASLHHRSGEAWACPAPDVVVVDTVGAGDAFVAALAGALAGGRDETEALEAARSAAGAVLSQRGSLPRTSHLSESST